MNKWVNEKGGMCCCIVVDSVFICTTAFCPLCPVKKSVALLPVLSNEETEAGRCSGFSQCLLHFTEVAWSLT